MVYGMVNASSTEKGYCNMMMMPGLLPTLCVRKQARIIVFYLLVGYCILENASSSAAAPRKKNAIVVGGGPAGLAAAYILAKTHGYQVTVLERNTKEEYANEAYSYAIKYQGQRFTQQFPEIQSALEQNGVASTDFAVKRVPAVVIHIDCMTIKRSSFR
jgi:threonine dehydrogenase-like Zn-dependent dehydrogenase